MSNGGFGQTVGGPSPARLAIDGASGQARRVQQREQPSERRRRRRRRLTSLLALCAAVVTTLGNPAGAEAKRRRRKSIATFPADWKDARSAAYANMDGQQCLRELRARGIPHRQVGEARGVRTPVRVET